jgi:hypothetical protein
MTNNSSESNKNSDSAFNKNMTTTDTPRTDAEIWDVVYHHKNEIVVDADFARELERELSEARALCAAQHKAIERLEQESKPEYWKEKGFSYCERAEKAEAEIERLKAIIKSGQELMRYHIFPDGEDIDGFSDERNFVNRKN